MLHRQSKYPIKKPPYTKSSHSEVIGRLRKDKEKGYTKAVDLWSLGVVTLCLLTGDSLVLPHELSQLSNASIAHKVNEASANMSATQQWKDIGAYARDFVKRLVVFDAADRMTAHEAIQHAWFCKPRGVGEELKKLYERANRHWHPRPGNSPVVEDVPDVQPTPGTITERSCNENDRACANTPKKLPDVTTSVYFSLDRHLQTSIPPRKRVLPPVPNGFLIQPSDHKSQELLTHAMAGRPRIRAVQGSDIFGQASQDPHKDQQESTNLSTTVLSTSSSTLQSDTRAQLKRTPSPKDRSVQTTDNELAPTRKRVRVDSFTPDERRLHDEVGRSYPKLMSARRYVEELAKRRQQQQLT